MVVSTEYVSDKFLRMNSCGIQNLKNADINMYRENGRKDYYLLYIKKGKCYVEFEDGVHCVDEGNLILFRPGVSQKYKFYKKDKSISCYIHFTGSGCDSLLSDIGMDKTNFLYIGKNSRLNELYKQMSTEYILKKPFYENMCTGLLLEFFSYVARNRLGGNKKLRPDIDKVCLMMHEACADAHPIKYYADMCNLSVSRFAHIFKDATGLAPLAYITRVRINYAKELLQKTSLSMSEISRLTGFDDQNYFSRAFKKHTGVSPKKYAETK